MVFGSSLVREGGKVKLFYCLNGEELLERSWGTHRIIVSDWVCDIAMTEANAYGFWTRALHKTGPLHEESATAHPGKNAPIWENSISSVGMQVGGVSAVLRCTILT